VNHQDGLDLTKHREHLSVVELAVQTLAAELILGRNAFQDRGADFDVKVSAQQRVTLVLEALDLLKRAALVRP